MPAAVYVMGKFGEAVVLLTHQGMASFSEG
jgi:hypothetical protein